MDITTALTTMISAIAEPIAQVQALIQIIENYGYDAATNSSTTANATVRQCALVLIGSVIADVTFTTSTDATALKTTLTSIFNAEYLVTTDTTVFAYLMDLQTAIMDVLTDEGYGLPALVSYTTKTSLPACVIAQNLYQDGTQDDQIILRNNAATRHPMFMPTTLEVLSYV